MHATMHNLTPTNTPTLESLLVIKQIQEYTLLQLEPHGHVTDTKECESMKLPKPIVSLKKNFTTKLNHF